MKKKQQRTINKQGLQPYWVKVRKIGSHYTKLVSTQRAKRLTAKFTSIAGVLIKREVNYERVG